MGRLCACGAQRRDGAPGAFLSLARLSELGSLGVAEMGAQACVFHELPRYAATGRSLLGGGEVGMTPVHRTSGAEAREKVCTEKFARARVSPLPGHARPWGWSSSIRGPPGHRGCGAAPWPPPCRCRDAVPRGRN